MTTAIERHPHLAAPRPAGTVRVDLHSHTMWSGDSTTTADELEEAIQASDDAPPALTVNDTRVIETMARFDGSRLLSVARGGSGPRLEGGGSGPRLE